MASFACVRCWSYGPSYMTRAARPIATGKQASGRKLPLRDLAPGLASWSVLEKFLAVQMIDVPLRGDQSIGECSERLSLCTVHRARQDARSHARQPTQLIAVEELGTLQLES